MDRTGPGAPPLFPMIDVLRGFAAVSVIVYHVIEHFGWTSFPTSGPLVWFRVGWMGVDLFFVISGFVIALSAFGLIDRRGVSGFRLPFCERRVRRIVPLHLLTCLLFLVAIRPEFFFDPRQTDNLLAHVFFLHNFRMDWAGAINGPNWSVALEMQFYLLILVTAPLLRDCRWWMIPLVCLPVAWAWRYGAIQAMPLDGPLGPYPRFWLSTQLPGTLDQFAAGILLARFVRAEGLGKLRAIAGQTGAAVLVATVAAALLAIAMALFWPHASFWNFPSMVIFWRTLAAFSFAALVLSACLIVLPGIALRATAPLRYLGTVSYGLYLWHLLVILSVHRLDWVDGARALPIVLVVTLVLAAGSWHYFEKPFMAQRRQQAIA